MDEKQLIHGILEKDCPDEETLKLTKNLRYHENNVQGKSRVEGDKRNVELR